MSECTADDPKQCKYFEQSTYFERCMFQQFKIGENYHCSCPDAQGDMRQCKEIKSDEELYIDNIG